MHRSWDTDSEEESSLPQELYLKIKQRLGEANEIISADVKPDEQMPKLKLVISLPPAQQPKKEEKHKLPPPQMMALQNPKMNIFKGSANRCDTLLKHFEDRQKDLLYMRIDNRNEMRLETENKIVNYFTGHFEDIGPKNLKKQNKVLEILNPNMNSTMKKKNYIPFKESFFEAKYPVVFDSCFESGNLFAAFKAVDSNNEFDLVMQNDINSRGNTQWFYFKCRLPKGTFKFNILNYTKNDSLFNSGMRVSSLSQQQNSKVWSKECENISYKTSNILRENSTKQYYTLSFQYTNFYQSNLVTFANCYPSTYSDVLNKCQKHLNKKIIKIPICNTYANLEVYALRIGELKSDACTSTFGNNRVKKKSLVLMARQHPGQTPASLIMDGILDSLFTYKQFDVLKKMFVIYLIPMLNPDGVVFGNYRTNLSGADLNRKWRYPSRHLHPEVYFVRRFLSQVNRQNPISMILDFHGHSKKLGSFFYGNPCLSSGLDNRVFPYLCSMRSNKISYQDCTFSISQDKKNTARVVLNQMFPSSYVYTFEASFSGHLVNNVYQQFTLNQYKSLGRSLLESLTQFVLLKKQQTNIQQNLINQLSLNKKADDDSGSDSQPEENVLDEMALVIKNQEPILNDVTNKIKPLIIKKNVVLKKGMIQPKHSSITMVDKATQTQRKYLTSQKDLQRRSQNKSLKESEAVLRILQLRSISPDREIFHSQSKKPYASQKKWQTKRVKVFGSSFTMKLWNKGGNNLSFQNKSDGEAELCKIISKKKPL